MKIKRRRGTIALFHLLGCARYGWERLRNRKFDAPPSIEIATVASNEGPYIAEWIHHHLSFGAQRIHIAVNRSTDHTAQIVRAIAQNDPRVVLVDGDAFDKPGASGFSIQTECYAQIRKSLRRAGKGNTVLLFIDIDEFWLPLNMTTTMPDWFAQSGWPVVATFNWLQVIGDDTLFEPTVKVNLRGRFDALVKTAALVDLPVFGIGPHTVLSLWPARRQNGSDLLTGLRDPSRTQTTPDAPPPVFIAHRMFRSPVEYLAILGRDRPHEQGQPFKTNRFGYRVTRSSGEKVQIRLDAAKVAEMRADFTAFEATHSIDDMMRADRAALVRKAGGVLRRYLALAESERNEFAHQFSNLDIAALHRKVTALERQIESEGA